MATKKKKTMKIISLFLINVMFFITFFLLYFFTKNTFFFIAYFYLTICINLFLYELDKNKIEKINKNKIINVMNILSVIDLKNKNSLYDLRKLELFNKRIVDNDLINFFEKAEVENNLVYYQELNRNYKSNDLDLILLNLYLYKEKNDQILINQNRIITEELMKSCVQNEVKKDNHLIIFMGIIFTLIFLLEIVYEGTYLWINCFQ